MSGDPRRLARLGFVGEASRLETNRLRSLLAAARDVLARVAAAPSTTHKGAPGGFLDRDTEIAVDDTLDLLRSEPLPGASAPPGSTREQ